MSKSEKTPFSEAHIIEFTQRTLREAGADIARSLRCFTLPQQEIDLCKMETRNETGGCEDCSASSDSDEDLQIFKPTSSTKASDNLQTKMERLVQKRIGYKVPE